MVLTMEPYYDFLGIFATYPMCFCSARQRCSHGLDLVDLCENRIRIVSAGSELPELGLAVRSQQNLATWHTAVASGKDESYDF